MVIRRDMAALAMETHYYLGSLHLGSTSSRLRCVDLAKQLVGLLSSPGRNTVGFKTWNDHE